MPLLDLSRVTATLVTLLDRNITRLGSDVTVTPQSPDAVNGQMNTMSIYLYHIGEEAYYTSVPGPGNDIPNVAKNPMALCLYYILTAHHDSQSDQDPFTHQRLMGLGIKTLHDFPLITDSTRVGGELILDPMLRGRDNDLQIIMRPVSPEDALSFWAAEDMQTTRLSSYYEVRVVMIEPEEPARHPGIVLSLGSFLVQLGTPHIETTRSRVRFNLPTRSGGGERSVEASPGRVTLDAGGPPEAPNRRLEILGANLAAGRTRTVMLRNELWAAQGFGRVAIDPDLNPAWNLEFAADRIRLDVQASLDVDDGAGGTATLDVLPGPYVVSVRVVQDEQVVQGRLKQITVTSNESGFFVAPRIEGPVPVVVAGDTLDLDVGPQFDLLDPALPEDAIELIVDGEPYRRVAAPPDEDGEFRASSVPMTSNTLTLDPTFATAVTEPEDHAVRLLVNGAESPPFWIELVP